MAKPYNMTDLSPDASFERHVYHRDQFAHYLRWTHILKVAEIGDCVLDFGCGQGSLLEVLYRNRFKPGGYIGLDIRAQTIAKANEKFANVKFPCKFVVEDLVHPSETFQKLAGWADKVCSFEVLEHVGKSNGKVFLENFMSCGKPDATYYLSTPNFDPQVGAAENHCFDAMDGNGKIPQEWDHFELWELLKEVGFTVIDRFGTFASQKDYKNHLTPGQEEVFQQLKRYYDSNLVSNIMAPLVAAEHARNTLWVMERAG